MENRADSALISKLAFEADVVISVPLDGGGVGGGVAGSSAVPGG